MFESAIITFNLLSLSRLILPSRQYNQPRRKRHRGRDSAKQQHHTLLILQPQRYGMKRSRRDTVDATLLDVSDFTTYRNRCPRSLDSPDGSVSRLTSPMIAEHARSSGWASSSTASADPSPAITSMGNESSNTIAARETWAARRVWSSHTRTPQASATEDTPSPSASMRQLSIALPGATKTVCGELSSASPMPKIIAVTGSQRRAAFDQLCALSRR